MSTLEGRERTLESELAALVVFAVWALLAFGALWLIQLIWPNMFPMEFLYFWQSRGNVWEWLSASWPLLLWGVVVTTLASITSMNFIVHNTYAERQFGLHTLMSFRAGLFEEILFRWLYVFGGVLTVKLSNILFFGWLGFGVPEWFQINVAGPVANFFTLGALSSIFTNPATWVTGAAVLSANAAFRDGHKYLGWFGYINSWFAGMFLFVLLFKYGILACILVHFAYDALIGVVRYIDMAIERQLGLGRLY